MLCAMRAYTRVSIADPKFPTKKVNDSHGLNFVPTSILRSLAGKNHDGAAFRARFEGGTHGYREEGIRALGR
ncbi:hypothetical protein EMIT0P2_200064 [Pseudomonas sp. IT-P2]